MLPGVIVCRTHDSRFPGSEVLVDFSWLSYAGIECFGGGAPLPRDSVKEICLIGGIDNLKLFGVYCLGNYLPQCGRK